MRVTIPNPNKPAEVDEIENVMSLLEDCHRRGGGWDMIQLGKWLEHHREDIWRACERLKAAHEEMYPPMVIETKEDEAA